MNNRGLNKLMEDNNLHSYEYGKYNDYKIGDVVSWDGTKPCIGIINKLKPEKPTFKINDIDEVNRAYYSEYYKCINCYGIDDKHNSLHYSYLRYATPEEIRQLEESGMIKLLI